MQNDDVRITGVMFYYYFVCIKKLWYFAHNITMEHNSEDVALGKLIDSSSYNRNKKQIQIQIDGIINIDFIDGKNVIHEVKKTKSVEEAGVWQLKYYLWYLQKKGNSNITGIIDYPKLKRRNEVELTEKDSLMIEETLEKIKTIIALETPPTVEFKNICKKCSYYELCFV